MKKHFQGILMGAAVAVALSGFAGIANSAEKMVYKSGDRSSGYTFTAKETNAMQDDDIANPGFLYVDDGEALWKRWTARRASPARPAMASNRRC